MRKAMAEMGGLGEDRLGGIVRGVGTKGKG